MFEPGKIARRCAMVAGLFSATILSMPANARSSYPEYVKSACKKDFKTFCPRYGIESTQIRQCMRSVADQLSPRCIDALERSGERRRK